MLTVDGYNFVEVVDYTGELGDSAMAEHGNVDVLDVSMIDVVDLEDNDSDPIKEKVSLSY